MTAQENNDLIGWMRKNKRAERAARVLVQFFDIVCQMTTWTQNNKFSILYIYFSGASSSPFAACSFNLNECEEEAIIKK